MEWLQCCACALGAHVAHHAKNVFEVSIGFLSEVLPRRVCERMVRAAIAARVAPASAPSAWLPQAAGRASGASGVSAGGRGDGGDDGPATLPALSLSVPSRRGGSRETGRVHSGEPGDILREAELLLSPRPNSAASTAASPIAATPTAAAVAEALAGHWPPPSSPTSPVANALVAADSRLGSGGAPGAHAPAAEQAQTQHARNGVEAADSVPEKHAGSVGLAGEGSSEGAASGALPLRAAAVVATSSAGHVEAPQPSKVGWSWCDVGNAGP